MASQSITKVCSVPSCESTYRICKGLCSAHRQRVYRYGSTDIIKHLRGQGATGAERFWSRVDKTGPDGCWIWLGAFHPVSHYALASLNGRTQNAHRVAYFHAYGYVPKGMVLHSCDNRKCVNPAHLREGTHADNMQDKIDRNRNPQGSQIRQAKLVEEDISKIRKRLSLGESQQLIANDYNLNQSAISDIKLRKTWRHVIEEES